MKTRFMRWLRMKLHAIEYVPNERLYLLAQMRCPDVKHWVEIAWGGRDTEQPGLKVTVQDEPGHGTDIASLEMGMINE